jgi:hypothetical protein
MTREDIIRIYNQVSDELCDGKEWAWTGVEEPLQRFAALVAEAEREACKKLAQEHAARYKVNGEFYKLLGENYAPCAATACDHIVHLIEERGDA